MWKRALLVFSIGLLIALLINQATPAPVLHSQDGDESAACLQLVETALSQVGSACAEMGRNEACYGHQQVVASFFAEAAVAPFAAMGDMVPLAGIQALFTDPADPATGAWGVAIMSVADAAGGDPLTLVLFGDTEITNAIPPEAPTTSCQVTNNSGSNLNLRGGPGTDRPVIGLVPLGETLTATGRNAAGDWLQVTRAETTGWLFAGLLESDCDLALLPVVEEGTAASTVAPMQAITLRTGEETMCQDAPNTLLIHAPQGQRSRIVVNGVDLQLMSTGALQAAPDGSMTVHALEGVITVTVGDEAVTLLPGLWTEVALDAALQPVGPPEIPEPMEHPLRWLPAMVDVTIYGEDASTALARADSEQAMPGQDVRQLTPYACMEGDSMVVDIPYGHPLDVEMTVGISYSQPAGVAATLTGDTGLEQLRVTCQQAGRHTLVLSVRYGDGQGEFIGYTFEVVAE